MRRLIALLAAFFALTPAADAAWVWPVSGEVITPYRNGTDPYATGQHRGIDIGAPVGTPVAAATSGEVRFAGTAGSSGLTISIRTGDGYDTSYLHLSSIAVRAGAHVSAGERIGAVGTTGVRSAQAPHLHFGVRDAGTRHDYHDPLAFLPPPPPPARAPEPPPPAPATAPQPAPPTPVPVGAPRTAPRPHAPPHATPHGRPHAAPHGRPHPVPRPRLHAVPQARPHEAPLPRPHVPHAAPDTIPDRHPPRARVGAARSAVPSPLHPDGRRAQGPHSPRVARVALNARPEHPAATPEQRGQDLGWVAACAGLLVAAALLGLTEDGRRATRRAHSRFARAAPLLLRR